jgi:hypothetical protein
MIMKETTRVALSKRTRFEVFKRDQFTCQYCGRKPPSIILHCDHILAVADGGGNEEMNLITSCSDCNLGKSDIPLTRIPDSLSNSQSIEKEKFEQVKAYNKFLKEKNEQMMIAVASISERWVLLSGEDPSKVRISAQHEASIRVFLRQLPTEKILECVDVAFASRVSEYHRFRYFCGVCWHEIKGTPKQSLSK